MRPHVRIVPVFFLVFGLHSSALAQELQPSSEAVPVPGEIAEPIRALLAPEATVVLRGTNRLEFWLVKELPLKPGASGPPSWTNVPEGALVGVLKNTRALNDIRGLPMKPGVYTLRYARQPQDGDHMGVSPHREFLLVAPAAADESAGPAGYGGAVALAKKTLGRSHPASLSIDPPATDAAALSVVTSDGGHKAVVMEAPTAGGAPLRFGLILVGQIDH